MFNAGTIMARMVLNIDNFSANMRRAEQQIRQTERRMSGFKDIGERFSKMGKAMTLGITLPLVAAGTAFSKMAMDAVESENLFKESMGDMASEARAWSEDVSKSLGLNAYEVRKNVSTFNVMLNSMGLTEKASYDMSKGMTTLAYDMASFYNLSPEEAFTKLRAGISGEIEPLKQLGVVIKEEQVENYALTHGIIKQKEARDKHGRVIKDAFGKIKVLKQEMTEEQKIMARYGLIMEATGKAQGDLARTADSPINQIRILKEQMKQIGIEIGTLLIPTVLELLKVGKKGAEKIKELVEKYKNLSDGQKKVIGTMLKLAIVAGPILLIIGKTITSIAGLVTAIKTIKTAMATLTATSTTTGVSRMASIFSLKSLLITGAIGLVVFAVYQLWKHWDTVGPKIIKVAKAIGDGIVNALKWVAGVVFDIGKFIISGLVKGLIFYATLPARIMLGIGKGIVKVFKNLFGINSPSKLMREYGRFLGEGLSLGMEDTEEDVYAQAEKLAGKIQEAMDNNIQKIDNFGDALVEALRKKYDAEEKMQRDALDTKIKVEEKASEKTIEGYKEELKEKKRLAEDSTNLIIKSKQDEIDAIDEMEKEQERLERKAIYDNDINLLKSKLKRARNDTERLEILASISQKEREYQKELDKDKNNDRKEQLNKEINNEKTLFEAKVTSLDEEYGILEEKEQERSNLVIANYNNELEALSTHYQELTTEENLMLEARKLVLDKNQTEMLELLKTYNPKWQDAGRTFSDMLLNGLISEKESMEATIGKMVDLVPFVREQTNALLELNKIIDANKEALGGQGEAIDGVASSTDDAIGKVGELTETTKKNTDGYSLSVQKTMDMNNEMNDSNTKLWDKIKEWYTLQPNLADKTNELVKKGIDGVMDKVNAYVDTNEKGYSLAMQKTIEAHNEMGDSVEDYTGKTENFYSSVATGITKAKEFYGTMTTEGDKFLGNFTTICSRIGTSIANVFNIPINYPKLKAPKLTSKGSLDMARGTVPQFDVDWFAKGGIFSKPKIIGVGDATSPEVVAPLNDLQAMIDKAIGGNGNQGLTVNFYGATIRNKGDIDTISRQIYNENLKVSRAKGKRG